MTLTVDQLKPLQRQALLEALRSPTHSLVRHGKQFIAHVPRESTSGIKKVQTFTYRLVRMLERDWLADFDEPEFPSRVTLNAHGLRLAKQLAAEVPTKARAGIAVLASAMLFLAGCSEPTPSSRPQPAKGAWTLAWCGGISSWGCGTGDRVVYPDKASCYEALKAMRVGDQPVAESSLKRNTVALCRPAQSGDGA